MTYTVHTIDGLASSRHGRLKRAGKEAISTESGEVVLPKAIDVEDIGSPVSSADTSGLSELRRLAGTRIQRTHEVFKCGAGAVKSLHGQTVRKG